MHPLGDNTSEGEAFPSPLSQKGMAMVEMSFRKQTSMPVLAKPPLVTHPWRHSLRRRIVFPRCDML